MPKGQVNAPDVLPAAAKEVYRSAFNGAYGGSCKERAGERDACAAKIAWSAVKKNYRKSGEGQWIEKAFEDIGIEINGVPLPQSLVESPFPAALTWIDSYQTRYESSGDISEASSVAWGALKELFEQNFDSGLWQRRSDLELEEAVNPEPVDLTEEESEQVELVVNRSARLINQGRGDIVLDGLNFEQEKSLLDNGYAGSVCACPEGMDQMAWADRPVAFRTVGFVLREKWTSRAYFNAIEIYRERGFEAMQSPSGTGEIILKGIVQIGEEGNPFVASGVLTRPSDATGTNPEHWTFRALTRGLINAATTAIRVPVNEERFRGPVLR